MTHFILPHPSEKKQTAAKLLAELFIHMMTGFLLFAFIVSHWKLISYVLWKNTRLRFVLPAVFYLLAIMEIRMIDKTIVPAIPPITIPRMFPWTCLDWHLSPVKKKACPDGHLGKQSTDSVDQEPCHALTPSSSHSLSQMSCSHWRESHHNIPILCGGYSRTLAAPQNGASLLYAKKPALLAAGRNQSLG